MHWGLCIALKQMSNLQLVVNTLHTGFLVIRDKNSTALRIYLAVVIQSIFE